MSERNRSAGNHQHASQRDHLDWEESDVGCDNMSLLDMDDVDPADWPCLGMDAVEQSVLAIIDAHPHDMPRGERLAIALNMLLGRCPPNAPLPPVPGTGKDGESWKRHQALLFMAELLEISKRRNIKSNKSPAEQVRLISETKPMSVRKAGQAAAEKFYKRLPESERATMARSLADEFPGYGHTRAARKAGEPVKDHKKAHRYQAIVHDSLPDQLQTRHAISICKALQSAGIRVSHPDVD